PLILQRAGSRWGFAPVWGKCPLLGGALRRQAKLLDAIPESFPAEAQQLGGSRAIPSSVAERLLDEAPFHPLELDRPAAPVLLQPPPTPSGLTATAAPVVPIARPRPSTSGPSA